jgi:hypothetical protein
MPNSSFPNPEPSVTNTWDRPVVFDHAMDCIAWMANVIDENVQLIEQEERWYEDTSGHNFFDQIFPWILKSFRPKYER